MGLPGMHSSCTFLSVASSKSSIQISSSCIKCNFILCSYVAVSFMHNYNFVLNYLQGFGHVGNMFQEYIFLTKANHIMQSSRLFVWQQILNIGVIRIMHTLWKPTLIYWTKGITFFSTCDSLASFFISVIISLLGGRVLVSALYNGCNILSTTHCHSG